MAPVGDKNVGRLDVTVNDAFECAASSASAMSMASDRSFGFQRTPCNAMLQRYAVQKLHGDEYLAVLVINFVDRADVRMIERRCYLSLASKTGESLRVARKLIRQELESDKRWSRVSSAL